MVISANVTHLRDARFATMNAYEDAEEANHSTKQMNDTTMWITAWHNYVVITRDS